ncbi:MAG: bifunctional oligoribonuclease/PAP phosphatase NrnA [Bacteroidales bacterium]|jgi:phosphoesterase RecJ-like protein|nr:bifunctional oligoribonuclease/PAP phosphatase NrnA [Bacteroidales bacterium]NLH24096.1 bifunctional oligoribonuclease/PAP phosphatase NrnA [Bacteroidales bacterium]
MKALFPKNLITCWDQAITRSAGIVLATHVNPDGDAVGAMTGLGLFLRQQGYRVTCICPSPYPGFLEFLDNGKNVLVFSHQKEEVLRAVDEANMLVAVDVSGLLRMEELGDVLSESRAFKVLMDHHIDPVMEDFDLVFSTPQVSSSCELIFRLLSAWKPKAVFSKEQATAFLTGIITDTNQFANSVYAETFNAASLLHRWGADSETIFSQVYQNFTLNRMHLMGYALRNIRVLPEYGAAYIVLTRDVLEAFDYRNGDTESFVNFPLAIKGIHISALFLQKEDHIKVSLRSKGAIAVNGIARQFFNGGGHYNASAGKMEDAPEKIEELLKEALGTIIA